MAKLFHSMFWSLVVGAAALLGGPSFGQSYPTKSVTIVSPGAPGNGYDIVARVLSPHFSERFKQTFLVQNMPGAGTLIATRFAQRAAPDGYTLLIGGLSNMVWNSSLYAKPRYDPEADFVPVGMINANSYFMLVSNKLGVSSLKQFVDLARAKPGTLSVAHAGTGTGTHLAAVSLMKETGIDLKLVAYRGDAQYFPDLIGGRVDATITVASSAIPQMKAGVVKALAILGPERNAMFSDVPTSAELGYPNWQLQSWLGLFVPSGTPNPIVQELRKAVSEIARLPDVKQKFENAGAEVFYKDGDDAAKLIKAERARWAAVISAAGIKPIQE